MRFFKFVLILLLVAGPASLIRSAELETSSAKVGAGEDLHAEKAEHGIPAQAVEVGRIGTFPITNSMLVTWGVALAADHLRADCHSQHEASSQAARKISGNGWWKVCTDFLEGIIGHDLVKKTFWFFATIFIFILFSNWLGLIPGFGTIGWGRTRAHGFHVTDPWFRGANADLNMTLGDVAGFFRLLDCLGIASERSGWFSPAPVCAQRGDHRSS